MERLGKNISQWKKTSDEIDNELKAANDSVAVLKRENEELKKKVEEEKNFHNKITKAIFNIKKEFDIGDLSFGYSTKELILNFKEKKDEETNKSNKKTYKKRWWRVVS
jgi:L-rhamnose mutarotase